MDTKNTGKNEELWTSKDMSKNRSIELYKTVIVKLSTV